MKVLRKEGERMQRNVSAVKVIGVAITLLGVLALSETIGLAQQKVEGMVVALKIEKCGMQPGSCEGTIDIGEPGKARTLAVAPGTTTINKEGHVVVLQEVKLGDRAVAEVVRKDGQDIAKVIDVHKGRGH